MATKYWRHPTNTAVAQVWKGNITTTTHGHTYSVTVTDDDGSTATVTYTVSNPPDTTTTLVATGFITAWNASADPLVRLYVATQSANQVILTAATPGVAASLSHGGTGTWSGTGVTTENVGNNDYTVTRNWSGNAIPVAGDDVIFDVGNVSVTYGLDQSSVAIDEFIVNTGCGSSFGRFDNGSPHYLRINPSRLSYKGSGQQCLFDVGSASIDCLIESYGTPQTSGRYGVYLKGSDLQTVTVNKGKIAIAVQHGETSAVDNLILGHVSAISTDADVTVGSGVTLTTVEIGGGTCTLRCGASSVTVGSGATLVLDTTANVTTVDVYGGTLYLNRFGTITNLNIYGGTVYLTKSRSAKTVTNTTFHGAGGTLHTGSWVTHTNRPWLSSGGSAMSVNLVG